MPLNSQHCAKVQQLACFVELVKFVAIGDAETLRVQCDVFATKVAI